MWKLNIYDNNDKIIKTVTAKEPDLRMGTVRRITEIISFDKMENTTDITKKLFSAWGELTNILNMLFPGMSDDDWDGVKVNELLSLIIDIGKYAVKKALTIPVGSEKN